MIGSYGNFEIMPLICPGGFNTCTPNLAGRERLRMDNTDGIPFVMSRRDNGIEFHARRRLSRVFLSHA
jgi:hypothetical protein